MKASLALARRNYVSKLVFAFGKSDLLSSVDFDFFDLAKFTTVDRFLIVPPILLLSAILVPSDAFEFLA